MSSFKRIIICCDGTWNKPDTDLSDGDSSTNVCRFYLDLKDRDNSGIEQRKFYLSGVGSGEHDKFRGGAFGWGLSAKMMQGYDFLIRNYQPGDRIYLFGFSRGAYTARSLGGLIRNCGILRTMDEDGNPLPDKEIKRRRKLALKRYRSRSDEDHPDSETSKAFRRQYCLEDTRDPEDPRNGNVDLAPDIPFIECIGVWDTVGSLGVPFLRYKLLQLLGFHWRFHDVRLSSSVRNAFHAIAIHERRTDFQPVLWLQVPRLPETVQRLEQVWFNGVHSDIGGGYPERGLSDISLQWMVEKAQSCGLDFKEELFNDLDPQPGAQQHESFAGVFERLDRWRGKGVGKSRSYLASIPIGEDSRLECRDSKAANTIQQCHSGQRLHESVIERFLDGHLRDFPASVLAEILFQIAEQNDGRLIRRRPQRQ